MSMLDTAAAPARLEAWLDRQRGAGDGRRVHDHDRRVQPGHGPSRPDLGRRPQRDLRAARRPAARGRHPRQRPRRRVGAAVGAERRSTRSRPRRRDGSSTTSRCSAPRPCSSTSSRAARCRPPSTTASTPPTPIEPFVDMMAAVAGVEPDRLPASMARPASWDDHLDALIGRWRAAADDHCEALPIVRYIAGVARQAPARPRCRCGSSTATSSRATSSPPPTGGRSSTGSSPASAIPAKTSGTTTPMPGRYRRTCSTADTRPVPGPLP